MRTGLLRVRCLALGLVAALLSASCTSFRLVKSDDITGSLKAGDTVKVLTRDGRERELEVSSVEVDAIVGKSERVVLADVALVERREIHAGKTVGLVLGVLGAALVVFVIVALAAAGPALALSASH